MEQPRHTAVVILAAGQGTRMRSRLPKVLHRAAGRSLLGHVLASASPLSPERTVIVAGRGMAEVETEARRCVADARIVIQDQPLGTGHAVRAALPALDGFM